MVKNISNTLNGIIKFQLAGINFGIHTDHILEIVQFSGVRPVPQPLPYVVGVTELRHYIVTVVDFRKRMGLPPLPLSKNTAMIVTRLSLGMFGILVESISDFRQVSRDMLLPPISVAGFPVQSLRNVLAEKDDIMLIPDFDNIFSSYINIRLVPITASEKLAFQYRFTPGALTRTLENTLINQHYLETKVIRKLSRSMSLPSVIVHKVSTYYSDYQPQTYQQQEDSRHSILSQKSRAGDATYLSLSQELHSQQLQQHAQYQEQQGPTSSDTLKHALQGLTHAPVSQVLEYILHTTGSAVQELAASKISLNSRKSGTYIARTCHLPSTRVARYFTFHRSPLSTQATGCQYLDGYGQKEHQILPPSSQALTARVQTLWKAGYPIEQLLQQLAEEHAVLQKAHIRQLCRNYRIAPIKVAKLLLYFPTLTYQDESTDEHDSAMADEEMPTLHEQKNEEALQDKDFSVLSGKLATFESPSGLSQCLSYLQEQEVLHEDASLQYVASCLQIPTCRLSKLRSYYWWSSHHE